MATTVGRYTNAPHAYDYAYVDRIRVVAIDKGGKPIWKIVLPLQRASYQTGRYSSGLFMCETQENYDQLADLLRGREVQLQNYNNVQTTSNTSFTAQQFHRMAWDVFLRFGSDLAAAAAAWSRMHENTTEPDMFAVILGVDPAVLS